MTYTREEMLGKKIGVVYGGINSEREVSLETGDVLYNALRKKGYNAILIDMQRDLPFRLRDEKIEVVFNALHGKWGEDGAVQGLLEVMGIPYTGTPVLGSALAMDKYQAKLAFNAEGIPVAPFVLIKKNERGKFTLNQLPADYPLVVKPNSDGSSAGISIVKKVEELQRALDKAFKLDNYVLIEKFIAGREIQVTVLNGKGLGAIWVKPAREFYDYEAKYKTDDTEYIYPAPLDKIVYNECISVAEKANKVIRGRGATRIDLIVNDNNDIVILELNTLPGMTSHSLVPKTAAAEGIVFEDLVERILLDASLELFEPEGD